MRSAICGHVSLIEPRYNAPCDAGWSSQVARRAHNPEVAGSNPAPATPEGPGNGAFRVFRSTRGLTDAETFARTFALPEQTRRRTQVSDTDQRGARRDALGDGQATRERAICESRGSRSLFRAEQESRALADHAGTRSGSRAIAQTLGWAITTAIQARLIKPDPISVAEIPIKDATGPASADPSGISTKSRVRRTS
jgi:hypothetical protein